MQDYEAERLLSPPDSLVQLARVSVNLGRVELFNLLAFLSGQSVPVSELPKLSQILWRAPSSLIARVASDLDLPPGHIEEQALERLGLAIRGMEASHV